MGLAECTSDLGVHRRQGRLITSTRNTTYGKTGTAPSLERDDKAGPRELITFERDCMTFRFAPRSQRCKIVDCSVCRRIVGHAHWTCCSSVVSDRSSAPEALIGISLRHQRLARTREEELRRALCLEPIASSGHITIAGHHFEYSLSFISHFTIQRHHP